MSTADALKSRAQANRGTLHMEDAKILSVRNFAGEQFVTRLQAPKCAQHATAGSFVHVQCDESIPMRRPLSIMRASAAEGWIEVLYKIVGEGLRLLSQKSDGDIVSSIGPIGHGFSASAERPRTLLIGGGVGIPPMIFLAETLKEDAKDWRPLVLMGSEIPFPFDIAESKFLSPWLPPAIVSTMPLLESWQVPARLASLSNMPGCFSGYVTDLARSWLASQNEQELAQTEIFSCGPTPMLRAVAALAHEFNLPCQVALEEFMACAVGGCAGCTVQVATSDGPAMKKVCVDGPVFQAAAVFGS